MKFALITPPGSISAYQEGRGYHMALAQAFNDAAYYRTYMRLRQKDAFIILDNGEAEGEQVRWSRVLELAERIRADEVVLPDAMKDADKTIKQAVQVQKENKIPARNRMVVPQGKDWVEWQWCLQELIQRVEFATIGVPKHIESLGGGRLRALEMIEEEMSGLFHIHFLGIYDNPILELEKYHQVKGKIRGIDSGAPIAWAQRNRLLTATSERYSLMWVPTENHLTVAKNIITLERYL